MSEVVRDVDPALRAEACLRCPRELREVGRRGLEFRDVGGGGQQALRVWGVSTFVSALFAGAESTLDVLYCEVRCQDVAQVRRVWTALSARLQGEEQVIRMLGCLSVHVQVNVSSNHLQVFLKNSVGRGPSAPQDCGRSRWLRA